MILRQTQIAEIFAHARRALPHECCGLVGGRGRLARSVYELENIAANRSVEYEAAPAGLFAAQKLMRERGEELLGIYHSHPRQAEPAPSETDVRRAFYPEAVYFIVGFRAGEPVLRAFRIFESERRWERASFIIVE